MARSLVIPPHHIHSSFPPNLISKILTAALELLANLSLDDTSDPTSSMPFTPHPYTVTSTPLPSAFRDLKACATEESLTSPNQAALASEFEQSSLLSELCFGIDTYYGPKMRRILGQLEESLQRESSTSESSPRSIASPRSGSNSEGWDCTPAALMVHAIRTMAHALSALQTTKLSPEPYIKLFSSVEGHLELFQDAMLALLKSVYPVADDLSASLQELSLRDIPSPHQVPRLNWYEVVQVVDRCIPRLYLMLAVGFAGIQLGIGDPYETIRDLNTFLAGCQHPLKAMVIRHYFTSLIKRHCGGLDKPKLLPLVLDNFVEIHKAWVRHQFNGFLDQGDLRNNERVLLQPLLATSVQLLNEYCNDAKEYSTRLLPTILEHVVASRDSMSQLHFMDLLIETFPMPYHLLTVDQLMTAISGFCGSVNIQPIVIALITRLGIHLTQSNQEVESFLDGVDSTDLAKILDCFWSCLLSLFSTRRELQLQDVFDMTLFIVDLSNQFHAPQSFIDRLATSLAGYLGTLDSEIPDLNVDPAGLAFVRLVKEIAAVEIGLLGIRELLRWLAPRCRFELVLELLKVESIPVTALVSLVKPALDAPLGVSEVGEAEATTLVTGFKAIVDRMLELASGSYPELWASINVPHIHPLILPFLLPRICQDASPEQVKRIVGQYIHRLALSPIAIRAEEGFEVFAPEYAHLLAIEVLVLAAAKFSQSETWSYELVVEALSVYEGYVTIADKQLAALRVIEGNLPALNFTSTNATAILDKLAALVERLLRRSDRGRMLRALASHYIRFHLEEGTCVLLTKIDKNLGAMQISDIEAYDEHRVELVGIGMELVKAAEPSVMSLPIDHLNVLISKYCQDREGLMDVLRYADELKRVGKDLQFVEKNRVEEESQVVGNDKVLKEHDAVPHDVEDAGFNADEMYMKPSASYSFIADISDTENPF